MAAASDISFHTARITGIPQSTLNGIKRRFIETGVWPAARGPNIPSINTQQLARLILTMLADVPAKDASLVAGRYFNLQDNTGKKLGDTLVEILNSFRDVQSLAPLAEVAYKSRLEVDCAYPRACLTLYCTDGVEEVLYGAQTEQWKDISVRRTMTISGKTLFKLAMGLHFGRWWEDTAVE